MIPIDERRIVKAWKTTSGLEGKILKNENERIGQLYKHFGWSGFCGYVGLPADHPLHGKAYDSIELQEIGVHGGLTFSGNHLPGSQDDTQLWCLGFDTMHSFSNYWTEEQTFQEVEDLAEQLEELRIRRLTGAELDAELNRFTTNARIETQ